MARDIFPKATQPHWRATVIHAYYALILECRDALARWGVSIPPRQNVHSVVRLRFLFAADADLKKIASALDDWVRHRNDASYLLTFLREFDTNALAQRAIKEGTTALASARRYRVG
ncbi:MAG: hypothetical protein ACRELG_27320 [Gemmataceae bacterium]